VTGKPYSINSGTNTFVISATDLAGLTASDTLLLNVTTVPIIVTISNQPPRVELTWSGGLPPWQLQSTTNLAVPVWQNIGGAVNTTNHYLVPAAPNVFYRVRGN